MSPSKKSGIALILPGAVAKGAYEAGVIEVLVEKEIKIDRIVATSSGALNAVALAAAIRAGQEKEVGKKLAKAWVEYGSWSKSFSFSPLSWLQGKGLSDPSGLLQMMRELVPPSPPGSKGEVELRIIVAPINGHEGHIGGTPATTYEKVLAFCGKDFDTQEGLEKIFKATIAASAFPGLFAPVTLEGLGPCFDGGTVNNAPIEYALDDGDIDHIIVAVPSPRIQPKAATLRGLGMMNHLAEILINERLYRDLKNAHALNRRISDLESLVDVHKLTAQNLKDIKSVLPYRKVKITEIRPEKILGGSIFTGFLDRDSRKKFIAQGHEAALHALP